MAHPASRFSLIIPAHNEEAYIGQCLDSVLKHTGDLFHEILVVDNASTDRTCAVAQARRGVRIVHEPRKGVSFARQKGCEEATGEILAYIDADTRVPRGWASIVAQAFKEGQSTVCLSGPYRYYDGPKTRRLILDSISQMILPAGNLLFGYMLVGGNFTATKKAIKEAGGFDGKIDFFGEDTDLGRRLVRIGKMEYRKDFYVWSSGRRFYAEGLLMANLRYLLNFLWVIFFHKPYSTSHRDIRTLFPGDEDVT